MTIDEQLLQIAAAAKPTTIDDVIDCMNRLDAVLPSNDGLKWFNQLYLLVTEAVKNSPPAGGWSSPQWLARLDVVFATFYFTAIDSALRGDAATPASWQVLFDARQRTGIDRVQFALAGMNAHINHDLSLVLLQTDAEFQWTPTKTSPEHNDFEHVNGILEGVLPTALNTLAVGLAGEAIQSTGKIGQLLAMWNVRAARDLAWDFADRLRDINGIPRDFALTTQDSLTGVIGRGLLLAL